MRELQEKLGYVFANKGLLRQALTHPSLKEAKDYQRLEFLGDAVLEFCISDMLYQKYPRMGEGELTARRAALVCEETLSFLAKGLGVGNALRMGHGEEQTMGREKPSILCDALEAVFAAIYLDGGVEAARTVIEQLFQQEEKLSTLKGRDEKGMLQEYTQAKGLGLPEYAVLQETGPAHDKHFVSLVSVMGKPIAQGQGTSKKMAEQAAARAALAAYQENWEAQDAAE